MLIYAGSDNDPGRYYFSTGTRRASLQAMLERPELEGHTLAPR